jgi:hypothetical protein
MEQCIAVLRDAKDPKSTGLMGSLDVSGIAVWKTASLYISNLYLLKCHCQMPTAGVGNGRKDQRGLKSL